MNFLLLPDHHACSAHYTYHTYNKNMHKASYPIFWVGYIILHPYSARPTTLLNQKLSIPLSQYKFIWSTTYPQSPHPFNSHYNQINPKWSLFWSPLHMLKSFKRFSLISLIQVPSISWWVDTYFLSYFLVEADSVLISHVLTF